MGSHSRPRVLLYFGSLVLLALVYGIFSQLTTSPCQMVKAPNIPPTLVDGELGNTKPPLDVQDVQQVRFVFHVIDYDERMERQRQQLIRTGEKAFPAYETILSDAKSSEEEVCGVLGALCDVKADRRRFIKPAVSRLTATDSSVRWCAVALLQRIGSVAEASPMIALLSDEDIVVVHFAAKALVAIGGQNELVAMDVWLRGVSHRDDAQLRQHVKKCRDELKRRLDEARAKDSTK